MFVLALAVLLSAAFVGRSAEAACRASDARGTWELFLVWWDQYFAQEQRIIREDGRAEVETFGPMVPKSQLMNHSSRARREVAEYLREFLPGHDTPDDPCQYGNTVFYKLAGHSHWRCRSCEPLSPTLRVKWFVLPRRDLEHEESPTTRAWVRRLVPDARPPTCGAGHPVVEPPRSWPPYVAERRTSSPQGRRLDEGPRRQRPARRGGRGFEARHVAAEGPGAASGSSTSRRGATCTRR